MAQGPCGTGSEHEYPREMQHALAEEVEKHNRQSRKEAQ
jgi:hypothetical protein